jgi:hypothetical protein
MRANRVLSAVGLVLLAGCSDCASNTEDTPGEPGGPAGRADGGWLNFDGGPVTGHSSSGGTLTSGGSSGGLGSSSGSTLCGPAETCGGWAGQRL